MEIKPLSQAETPSYPSANAAEAKALLAAHVPNRWRQAKRLAGALAVTLAANLSGGCGSTVSDNSLPGPMPAACDPPPGEQNHLMGAASDWIRSIYSKPQSRSFIMGARVGLVPPVVEGNPSVVR
jgi:hypothetical protein